jgi:hypothetical protein
MPALECPYPKAQHSLLEAMLEAKTCLLAGDFHVAYEYK